MNKRGVVLGVAILLTAGSVGAQVTIFEETFGTVPAGPSDPLPAGWTTINVDGRTPAASVAWVTDAWVVREDFILDPTDAVAFSTSWYSPAGASNDWAITPQIALTANNSLSWEGYAPDPAYPDGYEVRLSTTTPDVAGMTVVLATIPAEAQVWTPRSADLSAYAGQNVYIGFRNNSNDQFLLAIDDIRVTDPVPVELMRFSVE
jgi:hypothetical protein